MTLGGQLYPLPTLAHRTAASESSSSRGLLGTPRAADGVTHDSMEALRRRAASGARHRGTLEEDMAMLLPTPLVTNRAGMSPSPSPASIDGRRGTDLGPAIGALMPTPQAADARRGSEQEMGGQRPSGAKRSDGLATAALLKTPTAHLAVNGGSQHPDKRRQGGHGPTLADQVEHTLLPTPTAVDGKGPNPLGRDRDGKPRPLSDDDLPTSVARLLPTPTARLGDDTSRGADPARYKGPQSLNGRRSNLDDCIAAVQIQAPWLGEPTSQPSADGKPSPDVQPPAQLSLDEPESA
jgi:hypothetical protein